MMVSRNLNGCHSAYLCQFILKGVRDDGVKSGAEVYKQDPHISPWSVQMLQNEVQSHADCIIHRPVCSVGSPHQMNFNKKYAFSFIHRLHTCNTIPVKCAFVKKCLTLGSNIIVVRGFSDHCCYSTTYPGIL